MKKVLVIGAGKSGVAAAKLAKRMGNDVALTESKAASQFVDLIAELTELAIDCHFGDNKLELLEHCELIITSPGVPPEAEILINATAKKIEIISELEYASQFIENPIIAITGTNGKTTTTSLIEFVLNNAGKKAIACGNIGIPMSDLVNNVEKETILVVEASSYQLDRIKNFHPEVALILNITPDHLKYHGTMEAYVESKWKITLNQNEKNLLVLNRDDEILWKNILGTNAKIAFVSMSSVDRGIYTRDGIIFINAADKEEVLMPVADLGLPGIHNAYNSMAAALAVRAFELSNEDIRDGLSKFKGVEHRLEFVRSIDGIDFVNDSKATNVNATWYALQAYSAPIVWIAGGRADDNDYSALDAVVDANVKSIIAIGEEADNIFNHFCTAKRCIKVMDLDEALSVALEEAENGDKVVFTPACKSFDMFMNFEHRGEVFKEIVNRI
ncbi:MAG: UDP-N-acetylmuramoyl-L-alanine--D-glutamate ligase [Ignavibacteriae bacterium HGW-Ignavibacteriae-1]|nr:MAG: UDP-N-acetylmuramoyl-L-alanine--D-glutamate ligase [Ignavibacteriae bacterium HGW-Ignavibacteriae-1]